MRLKTASSLLTAGEEIDLARRVHGTDPADAIAARNEFVLHNLGLVGKAAAWYRRRSGLDYDDLFSEGMLGLITAAEGYDPDTHHTRFSTYASPTVFSALQQVVVDSALVRVPKYLQAGRPPHATSSPARAAQQAQCIARGQAALQGPRSLDPESDAADPAPSPLNALVTHETQARVLAALGKLPPLRAYILAHRRGLCGLAPRTLRSMAAELGLCRERIRQIEVLAAAELARKIQTLAPDKII